VAISPTLSSPGIGSGLDVNSIVAKLMAAEAAPLQAYDRRTASFQAKVSALGALSGAIGVFQSALGSLTKADAFRGMSSIPGDAAILSATSSAKATTGNYNVNVTQLAQAQTLTSAGQVSKSASIGVGTTTKLFFQFGTTTGGGFGVAGVGLPSTMHNDGIASGSLSINGIPIATSSATTTASALAEAINAKTGSTGVTAKASNMFSTFSDVVTGADGTYELTVGGVQIAYQGSGVNEGDGVTAAGIDAALLGPGQVADDLAAAGITFTGTAAAGTLEFRSASGGSIAIDEIVGGSAGAVTGGAGTAPGVVNDGSSQLSATQVTLVSANGSQITIGGTDPAAAGLSAGTAGDYLSGTFAQDAGQPSGTVTIDSSNNTLEGIRDAINKANLGVTASLVNDGSASPYRLVLSSTKTGEKSSMKITLSGDAGNPADPALEELLSYDPAGTRKLQQTAVAQDTKALVNGIAVTASSNSISEAIQGVTLNVLKTGSTTLSISKDAGSLKTNLGNFVKAYNDLDKAIKDMLSYDPETKRAGVLQGDFTTQSVQSQLRRMLGSDVANVGGALKNLGQVGIAFDKSGQLSLDSTKLQKAIDGNFSDIASLFTAMGSATDSTVSFVSSTNNTKPGTYAINVSQLATQGKLSSENALAPTTTIASNTTWSVILNDSVPSSSKNVAKVDIPAGDYTPAELAKVVQSAINGASAFKSSGSAVTASIDADGKLVLTADKYGSTSNVAITDESATGTQVAGVFGAPVASAGVDVAGSIDGKPVVGSGQTLTGLAGSNVEGLKIEITGGATGDRGTISFSQGYAYQLNNLASSFLGSKGLIGSRTEGINKNIKDIARQREKFEAKLTDVEARYRAQFTRLDTMLAQMQTTQQYLTQQLASLASLS
jgi:flagellar hook-associated protein 2